MGYTHYMEMDKKISAANKKKIVADMKVLEKHFKANGLQLFDGIGEKKGVAYKKNYFTFNGDSSKGEAHESFYVEYGEDDYNFCKTARKPYDVAVTAAMVMIKTHLGDAVRISGDGSFEGFNDGIIEFNRAFPERNVAFKPNADNSVGIDKEHMALGNVIEKI